MVPVGGAVVAGFDEKFIDAVSKTYPGVYLIEKGQVLLDLARLRATYLPSPGLGLGLVKGWVRVRDSFREGVGRDVARNQAFVWCWWYLDRHLREGVSWPVPLALTKKIGLVVLVPSHACVHKKITFGVRCWKNDRGPQMWFITLSSSGQSYERVKASIEVSGVQISDWPKQSTKHFPDGFTCRSCLSFARYICQLFICLFVCV